MSQINAAMVGNDFALPKPRLRQPAPVVKMSLVRDEDQVPAIPVEAISQLEVVPVTVNSTAVHTTATDSRFSQLLEFAHAHSFIVFAALFLLVASSGIEVGGRYWAARLAFKPPTVTPPSSHGVAGLNTTVPVAKLNSELATITGQSASLKVGDNTVAISPATIKSWLKITPNANKSQDYIHVNSQAMGQSLTTLAQRYAVAPVNQVTDTEAGASQVIVAGKNGAKLTDPSTLTTQAASAAKTVMNGSGLNFSTPLANAPFQAVTTDSFSKVILADLSTNRVYFKQNGQLVNTFLSSDGKPSTPTPAGEFKIWAKFTSQTMTGPGYVQPNVPFVNYFDHDGDAVHGVYWRPASIFGNVSTSHGCVGLPISDPVTGANDAAWAFDWAPIGTTVITYNS